MQTITLQTTNVKLTTKKLAEQKAKAAGFSSLQDLIRLFVNEYAQGNLQMNISFRRARDPEVRAAIDEVMAGQTTPLNPNISLYKQMTGDELPNRNNTKISKKL